MDFMDSMDPTHPIESVVSLEIHGIPWTSMDSTDEMDDTHSMDYMDSRASTDS